MRRPDFDSGWRPLRRLRHGLALSEVVVLLFAFGTIAATAVFVTPGFLRAQSGDVEKLEELTSSRASLHDDQQHVLDVLESTFQTASGTVRFIPDEAEPEAIQWLIIRFDEFDQGSYLAYKSDLLVLRHSRLLSNLTVYRSREPGHGQVVNRESADVRLFFHSEYLTEFIGQSDVIGQVIAVGVRDVRLRPFESVSAESVRTDRPDSAGWIELTWQADTADRPISALVGVPLPRLSNKR